MPGISVSRPRFPTSRWWFRSCGMPARRLWEEALQRRRFSPCNSPRVPISIETFATFGLVLAVPRGGLPPPLSALHHPSPQRSAGLALAPRWAPAQTFPGGRKKRLPPVSLGCRLAMSRRYRRLVHLPAQQPRRVP